MLQKQMKRRQRHSVIISLVFSLKKTKMNLKTYKQKNPITEMTDICFNIEDIKQKLKNLNVN